MNASNDQRYKKRRTRLLSGLAGIVACALCAIAILAWPMDASRYMRVASSGEMLDRSGALLYAFLNEDDQWCFARGLDELGPRIVQATLAVEDHRFYRHPGVDPIAVVRALWQNLTQRRIVSGGSTLSMQVVKRGNIPLPPFKGGIKGGMKSGRSIGGKLAQAVEAVRLEWRCTKADILRTYLNTAPYGLNLVGVEAASRRYFGKPARELTLSEAALIAGLPKAPSTLMPLRNLVRARLRRNYVLTRMLDEGFISEQEAKLAAAEPLGVAWQPFPDMAPHLAMQMKPSIRDQGQVRLTLDGKTQEAAQRAAQRAMKRYGGGIGNAAIMVVDVPTSSVLAYVGSADFFNTPDGGQVDACRARRSPGSALKPFTYALAMEKNLLYARETLLDDTLDLGAYNPENYDGLYNGLISATDALRHSLNVPAVMVLDRIGVTALHRFLCGTGFSTLTRSSDAYGLGLTLGNCEVRLDEMMAAYCMVANLGEYRQLSPFPFSLSPFAFRLSRGTCLKLFEMLEQPLPEELEPNLIRATGTPPRVCWKTGTSTGHHDAWAFVFNRQYLVGVWMGNNDGKPSNRLVGARAALPLAARVFRALPPSNAAAWPDPNGDLHAVRICAVSGLPASPWCRMTRDESLPRTQLVHRMCDVHYPMQVTVSTDPPIFERWPGAAKGWDLAKVLAPVTAREGSAETYAARRQALQIREPSDQGEYVLTGEAEGDRIRLRASLDEDTSLYWYVDDRYFGRSNPQAPLMLALSPGQHVLACMTPQGAMDRVTFTVAEPQAGARFRTEKD